MKLSFLLIVFSCSITYAQKNLSFAIKAGMNKCAVINDDYPGYDKLGLNAGIYTRVQLTKNFTGQLETLYTNKGSNYEYNSNKAITGPYYIKLNYIELPVLIQWHWKKFITEFGIGAAYLIDQREYPQEPNRNPNDVKYRFRKQEISGSIGVGYLLKEKIGLDLRYTNSIIPIRKLPKSQYNSVFTLSLFYFFWQKQ